MQNRRYSRPRLVERICREEGIARHQLTLHADNGGPMEGATLLVTFERLGVLPSHSRLRVSEDNPFSESLFKRLKGAVQSRWTLRGPGAGSGLGNEARVSWYNTEHLNTCEIQYVTPATRHQGQDAAILARRKRVHEAAEARRPERRRGETPGWDFVADVELKGHNRRPTEEKGAKGKPPDEVEAEEEIAAEYLILKKSYFNYVDILRRGSICEISSRH